MRFCTKNEHIEKRKRRKEKKIINPELEREWNLNREGFHGEPRAYLEMMRHCGKIIER